MLNLEPEFVAQGFYFQSLCNASHQIVVDSLRFERNVPLSIT